MGMWNAVFGRVAGQFDKAKAEGVPAFRELPSNVQTVICDLSVTFGDNFGAEDLQRWGSDPELWKLLTHGAWPDAVEELRAKAEHLRRNFPHTLGDRLDREADLLSKKD